MDADTDAYFAQHDIPSVVSDMLFELGFHRPKDVGRFMSSYVDRRFRLEGSGGGGGGSAKAVTEEGQMKDSDYSTIEVHTAPAATGGDEERACALLEEVRTLRKKYVEFKPQMRGGGGVEEAFGAAGAKAFVIIPWSEFRADYGRLLQAISSPQLWTFCERRLAQLRGLFDAHCALNARAEESEALSRGLEHQVRVDNCVQLFRALPPNRLLAIFRRKTANESAAAGEAAAGRQIRDSAAQLGRPVGVTDVTMDADAPPPKADELCGLFSRTSALRGGFLADATKASFKLLEACEPEANGELYAEYRLPLRPESGAWVDLARWAAEFHVRSARSRWVAQLPEASYGWLKERRLVLNYGELLDNACSPLSSAIASPLPAPGALQTHAGEEGELMNLLGEVVAFELAEAPGGAQDVNAQSAESERDPKEWTSATSPPYIYQLYHVWARMKAMNVGRDSSRPELQLRTAAISAEALACAYLLGAHSISRCSALAAHAPLQYLFVLDRVFATVSVTSRRSLGGAGEAGARAFSQLFRAGVPVSLCTEDPTVSHQVDNALGMEYSLVRNALGLSQADLAEIAQTSVAMSGFPALREYKAVKGGAAAARKDGKEEPSDPSTSIRHRFRLSRRRAELTLLSRLAPRAAAGLSTRTGTAPSSKAIFEES